jgi:hypothetical protein
MKQRYSKVAGQSKGFTLSDRRYLHRLAILGHRAPRDLDALRTEQIGNSAVGERIGTIFGFHKLPNQFPDGGT